MSGIYIPGAEMPKSDHPLWCVIHKDGTVEYNEWNEWKTADGKAIPVPDHGDLIDRDALERDIDKYIGGEESRSRFHHWVQVQRTVIPKSEEVQT